MYIFEAFIDTAFFLVIIYKPLWGCASYPQVIIPPAPLGSHYTARPCSARSFFAGLFSAPLGSHYTARPCFARSFFAGLFAGLKPSRVIDVLHKIRIVASLLCNWTFVQLTQNEYFVQYVVGVLHCGLFLGRSLSLPPSLPHWGTPPRTPAHKKTLLSSVVVFLSALARGTHHHIHNILLSHYWDIHKILCVLWGKLNFLLRKK